MRQQAPVVIYIPQAGPWNMRVPRVVRRGMGDAGAGSIASEAASAAATTGTILSALAAPSLAVIAPMFAAAGPIGIAVAGLTMLGLAIANKFQGCGNTCVEATKIAEQVGAVLTQNLNTYLAAPIHYRSLQLAALNNFDLAWQAMQRACGDPALQTAGQRCISDRQQGACQYKASPGGWQQDLSHPSGWNYVGWGGNGSGDSCWNWFIGMRDPIANDPTVVPDPVIPSSLSNAGGDILSAAGVSPDATLAGFKLSDLIIPAALIGAAFVL